MSTYDFVAFDSKYMYSSGKINNMPYCSYMYKIVNIFFFRFLKASIIAILSLNSTLKPITLTGDIEDIFFH